MDTSFYHGVLKTEGFEPIGSIDYHFRMTLWWHPLHRLEVSVVKIGEFVLLRASKYYRLKSMGEEGELYTRDLAAFDAYLTTLLGEVHLWLSSFPDITPTLARMRIREKRFRHVGNSQNVDPDILASRLDEIAAEFDDARTALRRDEDLLRLDRGRSSLVQRHLKGQMSGKRQRLEHLLAEAKTIRDQLAAQRYLENEYLRKGQATCLLFAVCSNVQVARDDTEFADALNAVTKELEDIHRYQLQQKLQGGKLQIYFEEIDAPGISLFTRWAGGALCPRQLARLGPEFAELQKAVENEFMVLPSQDIVLGGSVQDQRKLARGRIVRNFLQRLERVPKARSRPPQSPRGNTPVWVGNVPEAGDPYGCPSELPLSTAGHIYISGRTGSGKSVLARVIVESATAYDDLGILIHDPGNQWVGLRCSEDRPEVLARYKLFGLNPEQARSFDFTYHGVGQKIGEPLPADLRRLARGRRIICYKGLDDRTRCELFAKTNNAVFDACGASESDRPRHLDVFEESLQFTKRGVGKEDHDAAEKAELSIDRCVREGRKYGLQALFISQSARDFTRDVASVRQNITTRVFMQNSDREIEYAADFLNNGKEIVSLRRGEALFCNPEWGVIRVSVRPPLSKVWEPGDQETRKLVELSRADEPALSDAAQTVVETALQQYSQRGKPVRWTWITQQLGINSRRMQERIVRELEKSSIVRLKRLDERGRPLVIVPVTNQPPRKKQA